MNYRKIITFSSAAVLSLGMLAGVSSGARADNSSDNATANTETSKTNVKKTPAQTLTSYNIMTKAAGNKNYAIWKTVDNGKVHGKVANAIDFKYSHIQSNQSIKTPKYTYWLIYVNGRRMGWVNQNFFAKNKIEVAKSVSLVKNPNSDFDPKDAISYATDDTGTVVDPTTVTTNHDTISCDKAGTTTVKYTLGTAKASVKVTVRSSDSEGVTSANLVSAKEGRSDLNSWDSHYGASINYLGPHAFTAETRSHSWTSGDMTLSTKFYQPVLLSVKTDTNNEGPINRVGHIPEGVTVSNGWAYTSLLSSTKLIQGHIVGYNLNKLTNKYNAQKLLTMSKKSFINYSKNIKVSPYILIGHGQAMGSTDKYIYVLANDNSLYDSTASEELLQIRKSDMNINKVWTIKVWNGSDQAPRYFKNAVITSDKQMYGLYYDKDQNRYEYWELTRTGDSWNPTLVGATKGSFVKNNAPVQGFAFDKSHNNFYVGFNDVICKVAKDGSFKDSYVFNTGREVEGLSVSNNRLYVNLAQRAELLQSNPLN